MQQEKKRKNTMLIEVLNKRIVKEKMAQRIESGVKDNGRKSSRKGRAHKRKMKGKLIGGCNGNGEIMRFGKMKEEGA